MGEQCNWCGDGIEPSDGWRVQEVPGARRAAFCRLEHVVPWSMQGPHWEAGAVEEPRDVTAAVRECARCGAELGEVRLVLVRHRGEHRIPDAFCSVTHLREWAQAGGRYSV